MIMWKALVFKELKELSIILVLSTIGLLLFVADLMGTPLLPHYVTQYLIVFRNYSLRPIPFVGDNFAGHFGLLASLLMGGIAIRQTVGESWRGTYSFVLALPASRINVFRVKLSVGVATGLVVALIPILLYVIWAATPGTHASPFDWSMTVGSWVMWSTLPTIYLGVFTAGVWPGGWLGTRLLPVAAVGMVAIVVSQISVAIAIPMVLIIDALLLVVIEYVVTTRDIS